ncbi:MAG: 3'-5' exonuclease, partial [Patescibacteria group bacterium]
KYAPRAIRSIISKEKGKFVTLDEFTKTVSEEDYFYKIVIQVWSLYEKQKTKENVVDFDDLLLKTTELLKNNEVARKYYQNKWKYIHIDEYQDTNTVQYLMAHLLAGDNKNICVVGDPDQCIYSWRSADLKNILNFQKNYPETQIVLLEENYRSTQNILAAANEIIKKNKYRADKNLFTNNLAGEKLSVYEAMDENDEADFVARKILEIWKSELCKPRSEVSKSDLSVLGKSDLHTSDPHISIAILYRANFQSRALEEAMLRYNIPYQVLGVKFFERKEVKDVLAYLRAALNPENLSDIKRIINFPARGIGKATLVKIFAKENLPIKMQIKIDQFFNLLKIIKENSEILSVSDLIKFTVKKSGIEQELVNGTEEDKERLENIKELVTLAIKYNNIENGLEKLLEEASLASEQDSLVVNDMQTPPPGPLPKGEGVSPVKLMTVHASKGLEFNTVFVVGLEFGLFPHDKDGSEAPEDAEEERRLFYVALTRAEKRIFLSYASVRTIFGSPKMNYPSEFLSDISEEFLEEII